MARCSGLVILAVLAYFAAPAFVGQRAPQQLRGARVVRYGASDETFSKVADIIVEQLGVDKDKVIAKATLVELGADSLDIVETVMAMEEAFDVELPDEETTQLKNVGDVADLIQTKL
uniref:Acyl carrier protein n=1 Tax=Kryptoperidinium triquetrum TaxID=66468 RepID=Q5ENV3_KRYTR|nr:chloroplast acyl carrier protein [Heterocapsa triquetra]